MVSDCCPASHSSYPSWGSEAQTPPQGNGEDKLKAGEVLLLFTNRANSSYRARGPASREPSHLGLDIFQLSTQQCHQSTLSIRTEGAQSPAQTLRTRQKRRRPSDPLLLQVQSCPGKNLTEAETGQTERKRDIFHCNSRPNSTYESKLIYS